MKLLILLATLVTFLFHNNSCIANENAQNLSASLIPLKHQGKPAAREHADCFKDPATGLVWEAKKNNGGVHDANLRYRWGGLGAQQLGAIFFDDWNALVNGSNKNSLCGYNDWRVPTIDELKQLYTLNQQTPDKNNFPGNLTHIYWSGSAYTNYPEHAQTLDFSNGTSNYFNGFRGERLAVILVRGGDKK